MGRGSDRHLLINGRKSLIARRRTRHLIRAFVPGQGAVCEPSVDRGYTPTTHPHSHTSRPLACRVSHIELNDPGLKDGSISS